MHTPSKLLLTALFAASCLSAPRTQSTRLVGWVDQGPRTVSELYRQDSTPSCPKVVRLCPTKLQSTTGFAGASAFDPLRNALWISEGRTLELVDLQSCRILCTTSAQRMNTNAAVAGLATYQGGQRLLQLETIAGYAALRSYDARSCPPKPLRDGCVLSIPKGASCGGVAVDEARGLVWVSVTQPGVLSDRNFLRVHRLANKCTPVCEIELPICGSPRLQTAVLGLAYDACRDRLFTTDGIWTRALRVDDPLRCKLTPEMCCKANSSGTWRGVAVQSSARVSHYGKACTGKGCAYCSALLGRPFGGLPTLGNTSFGFGVENAPVPSFALLIVGAGRCTKGIGVPFLCGAIYPSLQSPTFFVGPQIVTGKGQCMGGTRALLPIPLEPKLCGATICLEWVVICGSMSGFALSDTWEVVIG